MTSSLPKIALAGPKGGGKTWIIEQLGIKLEHELQSLKLVKDLPQISTIAFADPIYDCQVAIFDALSTETLPGRVYNELIKRNGLDDKVVPLLGMSPRNFRQQFGIEFACHMNPDIWVNIVEAKLRKFDDVKTTGLIITDVRMPNEVELMEKEGFELFYINSMGEPERGSHATESYHLNIKANADWVITNKEEAQAAVIQIADLFYKYIEQEYTKSGLIVPKGKLN